MNQTLQKLRQIAQDSVLTSQNSDVRDQEREATLAKLAAPLIRAYQDVEKEFVRIEVMRQIWPIDYDKRDDRVAGLLVTMIGPTHAPYGLKLAVPHGSLRFEVEIKADRSAVYSCIRDTDGQRPMAMDFTNGDDWLEFFYKSIADLIEL